MSSPANISGLSATEMYLDFLKREVPIPKDVLDGVVLEHWSFVRYVARRIALNLPSHIDIDDLCSAGIIGLMKAVEKFDYRKNCDFRTYAEFRVTGAILDELRKLDWMPRGVRLRRRRIEKAYREVEQRLGHSASADEVADALGIPIAKFYKLLDEVCSGLFKYLNELPRVHLEGPSRRLVDDVVPNVSAENPFLELANVEVRNAVVCALLDLSTKERLVVIMYYYENLNQREIGEILKITENRVHQIRKIAEAKIQQKLHCFAHG